MIQINQSATLTNGPQQTLFEPQVFVKSKRAQTSDDFETWVRGGISPTMNAFDMGDIRTTVIVIENHPADSRVNIDDSGTVQTLTGRMGTGGGNVPMILEVSK